MAADTATQHLRRQAVRGGTLLLAARLGMQLFQWTVTLFVTRLLAPDDYGMMTAGVIFVGLADMLAEAGVGKALVHKKVLDRADLAQAFTLGVILSAAYALWLYRKVIFGRLEKPSLAAIRDLGPREIAILTPLVALTFRFGVWPKPVLEMSAASVTALIDNYQHAIGGTKAAQLGH